MCTRACDARVCVSVYAGVHGRARLCVRLCVCVCVCVLYIILLTSLYSVRFTVPVGIFLWGNSARFSWGEEGGGTSCHRVTVLTRSQ